MIKLSPSALSTFKDCPRCFWLEKIKGIKRPRGIFPSLPGGMDGVIKQYFDTHRVAGSIPPEIDGIDVQLFTDSKKLQKWRNWRSCDLTYTDPQTGATLSGALDDLLITSKGTCVPFDYKTRGSAHKEDPKEYSRKYYGHQVDSYALMLKDSGYLIADHAYFAYYYPKSVTENGIVSFGIEIVKVELNLEDTKKLFLAAVETLNHPEVEPESSPGCEYCNYTNYRGGK